MKTVLPVPKDHTLPTPIRVQDEEAVKMVKSGQYIYCPKAYYKKFVLGKSVNVTEQDVWNLLQKRNKDV
jgi:hypothetical protein